jgi:hypothetical protein
MSLQGGVERAVTPAAERTNMRPISEQPGRPAFPGAGNHLTSEPSVFRPPVGLNAAINIGGYTGFNARRGRPTDFRRAPVAARGAIPVDRGALGAQFDLKNIAKRGPVVDLPPREAPAAAPKNATGKNALATVAGDGSVPNDPTNKIIAASAGPEPSPWPDANPFSPPGGTNPDGHQGGNGGGGPTPTAAGGERGWFGRRREQYRDYFEERIRAEAIASPSFNPDTLDLARLRIARIGSERAGLSFPQGWKPKYLANSGLALVTAGATNLVTSGNHLADIAFGALYFWGSQKLAKAAGRSEHEMHPLVKPWAEAQLALGAAGAGGLTILTSFTQPNKEIALAEMVAGGFGAYKAANRVWVRRHTTRSMGRNIIAATQDIEKGARLQYMLGEASAEGGGNRGALREHADNLREIINTNNKAIIKISAQSGVILEADPTSGLLVPRGSVEPSHGPVRQWFDQRSVNRFIDQNVELEREARSYEQLRAALANKGAVGDSGLAEDLLRIFDIRN